MIFLCSLIVGCASAPARTTASGNKMIPLLSTDGIILSVPQGAGFPEGSIKLRKVLKNDLTEFYTGTVMGIGAGPSVGWSVEIESAKEISVPLKISIPVPEAFLKQLDEKYQAVLFYYFLAVSELDTIPYLGSIPSTLEHHAHTLRATLDPSLFREYFRRYEPDKDYLMMLIVGSEPIEKRRMP